MKAELNFFAQKPMRPVKASQIVSVTTPLDIAKLVHEELPQRFAHRLKHMENLENWQRCEELVKVHEVFAESFRDLRLVEPTDANLPEYSEVINKLRERHKAVVPLLGQAIQRLYQEGFMLEKDLNAWVDEFMSSRIATEMLTAHFSAVTSAHESQNSDRLDSWWGPVSQVLEKRTGIVDTDCDPAEVCRAAAECVRNQFPPGSFEIEVEEASVDKGIAFCYISKYLFFILEELLKNSARAVLSRSSTPDELERNIIRVSVCADPKNVAISICDTGGGIRAENLQKIWSYSYTTRDETEVDLDGGPLSGYGMGLPLARLYVQYLGGSLDVMNMPGSGVDLYLFLNRIELGA